MLFQAGYIDPEFTRTHEYHRHCEVYSMGITILQVCDNPPSLPVCLSVEYSSSTMPLYALTITHSQSHTHIHSLSLVLVVMMKSKEFKSKIYSHAHFLILSLCLPPLPSHSHPLSAHTKHLKPMLLLATSSCAPITDLFRRS